MSIVKTKYRGSKEYVVVLAELVRAAQYRGTVTYQEIAPMMGLRVTGAYMGVEVGQLVGEISEDEVNANRPMLSAVVVGTSGEPGPGFYALARGLGLMKAGNDERKFWRAQLDAVYQTWQRPLMEQVSAKAQAS
jgi:hypothetical protein